MIKKTLLGASLFAMMAVSGAHAADAIVSQEPAPYAANAFSFGGAYVGGEIGWGWAQSKLSAWDIDGSEHFNSNGFLGGVYAGYNFDMGNSVILGIDGNFDYNDLKKSHDFDGNNQLPAASSKSQLEWSGAVRARAGYAFDRFMPYIAGGVAFGDVKTSYSTGGYDFSNSKTKTGWTIGAGLDYAATDNILLRFEYRYTDFGHNDFDYQDISLRNSVKTNDIRLGIAYKF